MPDRIVNDTTEDDFIEFVRCSERLRCAGISSEAIDNMALRSHICLFSGRCFARMENVFLGARTCLFGWIGR
ncbi:Uncharacterised protein [uncultured archaeon]|nr:Uncharacterised protein [uncultured archaeon]